MIKSWIITGDTHGDNKHRLGQIYRHWVEKSTIPAEEIAVIILGDAGYNFYLNDSEKRRKKDTHHMWVYCVRGNHEERPENLGYSIDYDPNVQNYVYVDPVNEKIRYFIDGGQYQLGKYSVLVIGGAYSVDKYYRLERAAAAGSSFTGWYENEQLTEAEMKHISENIKGKKFDFILSHTCPLDWEPTDLFLSQVDQSSVDKSMEIWLNDIKDNCNWDTWLFGHYHRDRLERPHVEMFYHDSEPLDAIWERWHGEEEEMGWDIAQCDRSPNYYK